MAAERTEITKFGINLLTVKSSPPFECCRYSWPAIDRLKRVAGLPCSKSLQVHTLAALAKETSEIASIGAPDPGLLNQEDGIRKSQ